MEELAITGAQSCRISDTVCKAHDTTEMRIRISANDISVIATMSKPLEIEVKPWKEIGLSKPARSVTKILKGGSSKTDWKTSDRSSCFLGSKQVDALAGHFFRFFFSV